MVKRAPTSTVKIIAGLAPAIILLAVLFLGALSLGIVQSFGYAPQYGVNEFPTVKYYQQLFAGTGFWKSLGLTFYYSVVPTLVGAVLSLILSVILARRFKARGLFLFLYKIPMVVPYLVGVSLVLLLFTNGGLFARLFYAVGVIESPSEFPRLLQSSSGIGIMVVYLWKQVPFMTLMLYSNLLVLGREQEESAMLLGASGWQIFWHVTFPRLTPSLVGATLIVFAFNFGGFEVPFILGAGYPNTLTVEAWRLFSDADYTNRPSAMAVTTVITIVSAICLLGYLTFYRRLERKRGRI
ncbi:ABC transporter permease [Sneathiella aquimaris]|uniref:ABC transporter permease n=1 Tax=Sneathiella aquimaris TaxID=2599305 RepID=UPI00146DD04B|nr:sugar ABC transporter permease [Sneathiella aquimaris]